MTRLLHKICISKFVFRKRLDVRYGFAPEALGEELDLVALDIFHGKDVQPLKEVEGGVVDGIAEDGFLNEEDIAASFFDLFADVQEVLSLFFEDLVHLAVIRDDDGVVHLGQDTRIKKPQDGA
jgi:hypothetical protein